MNGRDIPNDTTEVRGPEAGIGKVGNALTGPLVAPLQHSLIQNLSEKKGQAGAVRDARDEVSSKIADLPEFTKKGVKIPKDLSSKQRILVGEFLNEKTGFIKNKKIANAFEKLFNLEKEERAEVDLSADKSEYTARQEVLDIQYRELRKFVEEYARKELNMREEDIAEVMLNDPKVKGDERKYYQDMEQRGKLHAEFAKKMKFDSDFNELLKRAENGDKGPDFEKAVRDFGDKFARDNGLDNKRVSVVDVMKRFKKDSISNDNKGINILISAMEKSK